MFQITEQGEYNILSNCDSSKSPGPDCIHPYTLKTIQQLKSLRVLFLLTGSTLTLHQKVQNLIQETILSHLTHIQDNPSMPNYETSRRCYQIVSLDKGPNTVVIYCY